MSIELGPRPVCEKFHPGSRMLVAYVPCRPFEAEICEQCEEVVTYWGPFKSLAWNVFIGWWWDGSITVLTRALFPEAWRR